MNLYTVWVGGGEVNDTLLNLVSALNLAEGYKYAGYNDVVVTEVK